MVSNVPEASELPEDDILFSIEDFVFSRLYHVCMRVVGTSVEDDHFAEQCRKVVFSSFFSFRSGGLKAGGLPLSSDTLCLILVMSPSPSTGTALKRRSTWGRDFEAMS